MPLPVLHSFAGYSVYKATNKNRLTSLTLAVFSMFAANAADLDFIPGILIGDAGRFHHGAFHSFGAAVIFGLISAFILKSAKKLPFGRAFTLSSLTYASHVVLDVVTRPTEKLPLLWPFFSKPITCSKEILFPVLKNAPETAKTGFAEFLRILSGPTTYNRIANEIILVLGLLMIAALYREIKNYAAESGREKEAIIPRVPFENFPGHFPAYQPGRGQIAAFTIRPASAKTFQKSASGG